MFRFCDTLGDASHSLRNFASCRSWKRLLLSRHLSEEMAKGENLLLIFYLVLRRRRLVATSELNQR